MDDIRAAPRQSPRDMRKVGVTYNGLTVTANVVQRSATARPASRSPSCATP
jgi:hypothetical protein